MTEDRLSQREIKRGFRLRNRVRRVGKKECRAFDLHQRFAQLPPDSLIDQPFVRLYTKVFPPVQVRNQKPSDPQRTATQIKQRMMLSETERGQEIECHRGN